MEPKGIANIARSKTVWTGLAAIIAAGAAYAESQMTGTAAIQIGLNGLLGIFLRIAIEKVISGR